MATGFRDYLVNERLAPAPSPQAAPPQSSALALLQAVAAAKIKQLHDQQAQPAPTQNMPIPTPPGQNPYNSANMANAQAVIAAQNAPVQPPNAQPYSPNPITQVDQGPTISDTASTVGNTVSNVAQDVAAGATIVGRSIGDRYVQATKPIISIDPNTGQAVSTKNPQSTFAPYLAVADTLGPIAKDTVGAVAGGVGSVVSPVADSISGGVSGAVDNTWGQLSDEQKMTAANQIGLDHPPTSAELAHGASQVMHAFDWPRANIGTPLIGAVLYQMASGGDAPFGLSAVGNSMDADTKAQIIAAYQKDGGKGVWEDWVAKGADFAMQPDSPMGTTLGLLYYALFHAGIDLAADPLTWAPLLGESLKGVAVARGIGEISSGAEDVGRVTKAINAAGTVLAAPNAVPDAIMETAGHVISRAGQSVIDRVPGAGKIARVFTPDTAIDRTAEDVGTSLAAYQSAEHATNTAIPGVENFPVMKGETPYYVSSDGQYIVTVGPAMTGQPGVTYRIRSQDGRLVRVAIQPKEARDLAEQAAFADGIASDRPGIGASSGAEAAAPVGAPEPVAGPVVAPSSGVEAATPPEPVQAPDVVPSSGVEQTAPVEPVQTPDVVPSSGVEAAAPVEPVPPPSVAPESGALATDAAPAEPQVNLNPQPVGDLPPVPDVAVVKPVPESPFGQAVASADNGKFTVYESTAKDGSTIYQVRDQNGEFRFGAPTQEEAERAARRYGGETVGPIRDATPTPNNPRPGWTLEPKPQGARAIDWIARERPDAFPAIKADLEAKAAEYEPLLNATSKTDPIKNRLLNAELSLDVRDAALKHGIEVPPDRWELSVKGRKAESALTKSARMERVIFSADEKLATADRNVLYLTGDLRKAPPADTADILAGDVKGRRGHPGTLAVNDAAFDELPPEIRNYARSRKAFEPVKGEAGRMQYIGHEFSNADLQAMSAEQRATLARTIQKQQDRAYQDYQHLQEIRSRMHVAPPASGNLGIVSDSAQKGMSAVERIKQSVFNPELPSALPEPRSPEVLFEFNSEPIKEHYTKGRLTSDQAVTLEQDIAIGKDKLGAPITMKVYERYDQLVAEGMTERQAALQTAQEATKHMHQGYDERKLMQKVLRAYDTANQAIKEGIQYNIVTGARGSFADMAGDSYTMLLSGHGGAIPEQFKGLGAIRRAAKDMRPDVLNEIPQLALLRETGGQLPERYVNHNWKRWADGAHSGEMSIVRVGDKVGAPKEVSRFVGGIFQNQTARDWRNAFDASRRISVFADQYSKEIAWGLKRFDATLAERAGKSGADPETWINAIEDAARERTKASGAGEWTGAFSPEDILHGTGDEQLARTWRSEINRATKVSDAESNRVLFSYNRTPADTALSRVVYFHYWSTRALALHTSIALRNPFLIAMYARTWDGMNKIAAENGYPKGLRGFIQFMGSASGFESFFNPLGIIVPYTMFNEIDNPNAPWWKKAGLFLSPLVEGALAAYGGTDTIPDITGTTSVRNMVMAVSNFADANGLTIPGLGGPDGQLSGDFVKAIEQSIYHGANVALNKMGLTDKDYAPYDPKTSQITQIRAVVMQKAIAKYGPQDQWTAQQQADVDTNLANVVSGNMDKTDLSAAAYKEWADAQLASKAAGMVIPGGVVTKYGPLERMRALNNQATDAYNSGITPTPEQQAGSDFMDGVNAGSPEAMALTATDNQYHALGSERDQALSDGWNAIAFGTGVDLTTNPNAAIVIGGRTVQYSDIAAMSDTDKKALADAWVAENGGTDELKAYQAKRKDFVTQHPEYGDFKDYQTTVYNYKTGISGFRKDTAKANPNFQQAMDAREQLVRKSETSDILVNKALDRWAASLAGYEATQGVKTSIYDAPTKDVRDQSQIPFVAGQDTTAGGGSGAGTSGTAAKSTSKKTTADKLTTDIANYQRDNALASGLLSQYGISNLDDYQNPYVQPFLKSVIGDAAPTTTPLMDAYSAWQKTQPAGADTSPQAFATYYDAMQKTFSDEFGADTTTTPTRLMALYSAWVNAQPPGADISTDAFTRYLKSLTP